MTKVEFEFDFFPASCTEISTWRLPSSNVEESLSEYRGGSGRNRVENSTFGKLNDAGRRGCKLRGKPAGQTATTANLGDVSLGVPLAEPLKRRSVGRKSDSGRLYESTMS